MSSLVYFNGILMNEREVAIPLTDRSYLYGEGLFETLKATHGFVPFLPEHLDRLFSSIQACEFTPDISPAKMEFAVYQTLFHNQLKEASIRVNISRQNQDLNSMEPSDKYNIIVFCRTLKKTSSKVMASGASAILYQQESFPIREIPRFKTTNYLSYLRAKEYARSQNVEEAILLNTQGNVVEGSMTNLFLWSDGSWWTPALSEGPLPGVTRRVLIQIMERQGIPFGERAIPPQEMAKAQEMFLSNALCEVLPLTQWENQPVGSGEIGQHTQQLQELLREEIQFRFENFESKHWGAK